MEAEAAAAVDNNDVEVFVYMGGDMVVPSNVVRARVHPSITVITPTAFQYRDTLEEIELCEGLLEIGVSAFSGCVGLKKINIPPTVTKICEMAFYNCQRLEEINLSEGLLDLEERSFWNCRALTRISIPSTVSNILEKTFERCVKVEEVRLLEGLLEVGEESFINCKSLKHINIPSTVKMIGRLAFCWAPLRALHLPDSVESIGDCAFAHGRFPNVRIPPLITTINDGVFYNCSSVFSAELPETVARFNGGLNGDVFNNCRSLRNVAVPPHTIVDVNTFNNCTDLLQLFGTQPKITSALKHRFDNLLVHKMVYYHSYNNLTSEQLNNAINVASSQTRSHGNPTGNQQDCLGMTPLHILACSSVHHLELYQVLIEKYPKNLITEDRWGTVPLLYAVWGDAPSEILQLLVNSYKSIYPDYEFDWTSMITTLGERCAPECSIKMLLDLQKVSFSAQKIDWDKVLNTLANNDAYALRATFQCLVKVGISTRVDAIGIKLWRDDMAKMMVEPIPLQQSKGDWLDNVKTKLATYEAEYYKLKEATTIVELVLWKNKMNDQLPQRKARRVKKMKIEDSAIRKQCRVSCASDVVNQHVLPYLLPQIPDLDIPEETDSESEE